MIRTKRIYEKVESTDGFRILIDRLWPRGLRKEEVKTDLWLKDIAPSDELRKWFGHDPEKWEEFKKRYFEELKAKRELVDQICEKAERGSVTLLFGAKEERLNNASALKAYLERM